MEFRLFGEVAAVSNGGVFGLGSGRTAAVLSLLLLNPGRPMPVERLADELWGDEVPSGAVHAVRVYISRLRGALAEVGIDEPIIVAQGGGYLADVPRSAVDVLRFEAFASEASTAEDGEVVLALSEEALALWTGEPLADFQYEEFALRERRRLTEMRVNVIELWARAALDAGRSLEVAASLAPLVDEHPYRERLWSNLATALYREGRQTEALRSLERARSAHGDVGLNVGQPLVDLETSILRQDVVLRSPGNVEHNLPVPVDSFVGRTDHLTQIEKLLYNSRLVMLTGPGGSGKTRLAVESAWRLLSQFDAGVWLVDLATVSAAEAVPEVVAETLGLGHRRPRGPTIAVAKHLGDQAALLVLDNCEHVLESAAILAEVVLRRCPNVRILATSRETLRIAGETVLVVPSLSIPSSDAPEDELASYDAVSLFVDRTASAVSGFSLTPDTAPHVAEIVRHLDGIPLAIELAAVRVRTLPVDEMARRLDDVFAMLGVGTRTALPRHRTLEAALDWSVRLLDEREQTLFRWLGVFRSDFGLQAAAKVADDNDVEAVLAGLMEKSVLVGVSDDEQRYRFLEPVRQFSTARLEEAGELEEVERRRDDFYSALAAEAGSGMRRHDDPLWQQRIRRERPNLIASVDSLLRKGNVAAAAEMTAAMALYWRQFGLYQEGRRLIDAVLTTETPIPRQARSQLLLSGTFLAADQGDYAAAETFAAAGTALADDEGSKLDRGRIFNSLGSLHAQRGDMRRARDWLTKAIEFIASSQPAEAVPPTINLAAVSVWAGETAEAERLANEVELLAATEWPGIPMDHFPVVIRGMASRMRGDLGRAALLLEEAVDGFAESGGEFHVALSRVERAIVAFEQDDLEEARRLSNLILDPPDPGTSSLFSRIRARLLVARLAAAEGSPDQARSELLGALDEAEETTTVGGIAEAADIAGYLALAKHEAASAVQLLNAGTSLRRDIDLARDAWEKRRYDNALARTGQTAPHPVTNVDPAEIAGLIRQFSPATRNL